MVGQPTPVFDIGKDAEVKKMWFVGWGEGDFMAILWRDTPASPWRAVFRFRHYVDDKAFDSKDIKSVYRIDPADQSIEPEETCRVMDMAAEDLKERANAKTYSAIEINGGPEKLQEIMAAAPWAHVKVMDAESGIEMPLVSAGEKVH